MTNEPGRPDRARSPEIDAILAGLPDGPRRALEALRETIGAAAPEAVEGVSYGVPALRYRGRPLVSFGAAKAHCSFYVQSPAVMDAFADELQGFRTSKGTVHFTEAAPIPADLVGRLVRARMAETDAAAKR
jgi:uncharacterized protein YdhG (YjbR/CyaY superfamily)